MALTLPESMEELVYWTSRKWGDGRIKAWVFREECPECNNAMMGKPIKKDGKPKVRAKYYECPECKYQVPKQEYEDGLTANVQYTCPHCKHKGEIRIPYKRKTYKGVKALVFKCEGCNEKVPITKKMKKPKK